jgi:hypothetical protein
MAPFLLAGFRRLASRQCAANANLESLDTTPLPFLFIRASLRKLKCLDARPILSLSVFKRVGFLNKVESLRSDLVFAALELTE